MLFGLDEIGAILAFTGETAFTHAGMTIVVVGIEPFVAVVELRLVEKSAEGAASIVMAVFDESVDLIQERDRFSHKRQHVRGSMDTTLI